jgi:hypothetical protein
MDYCPRCFRVGDDIGSCGNFKMGCPNPKKVDPDNMVVVRCGGRCNKTRAVPVGNIMKGKTTALKGTCLHDLCKAVIVRPAAPPAKARGNASKD